MEIKEEGKIGFKIQSNSVITNSTVPSVFVHYNREFVITVNIYVVK